MTTLRASLTAAALAAALLAGCGSGSDTTAPDSEPTTDADGTSSDDVASGGSQPAVVALSFDGQGVPIARACNGADGGVVVTTDGEVTITLVQEGGTALRYNGEGMTAETSEVSVEQVGDFTVYRATLESDQVPAVDVTLELTDTSVLEPCQA